jgi:hypothetical protein
VLKKTIKYTDFNGEEAQEDFLFHLSKAELVELEMSHEGGFVESMQKVVEAEDNKTIIAEFKKIILQSYGKKSMDGKRFIKNQTMRDEFESSEAYSTLFMELVTDTDAAIEFMNGIIPGDLVPQDAPVIPIKPEPTYMTMKEIRELPNDDYERLSEKIVSGEIVVTND